MREVERQKERTFESKSNNKPKDRRTNTEMHTLTHTHNKHTYKIGDLVLFHINTHSNESKKSVQQVS